MIGPLRILDWVWLAIGLAWAAMVAVEMLRRQRAGAVLLDIRVQPTTRDAVGRGRPDAVGGMLHGTQFLQIPHPGTSLDGVGDGSTRHRDSPPPTPASRDIRPPEADSVGGHRGILH